MKKMIKVAFIAVALVASVSTVSFAQGGGGGRGGAGGGGNRGGGGRGGVAMLLSGVSDSAAVSAKATEIFTKYQADIRAGQAGRGGAPADSLVKKSAEAMTKRNDEIKALLSKAEDKAKFDANVKAASAPRGGGF